MGKSPFVLEHFQASHVIEMQSEMSVQGWSFSFCCVWHHGTHSIAHATLGGKPCHRHMKDGTLLSWQKIPESLRTRGGLLPWLPDALKPDDAEVLYTKLCSPSTEPTQACSGYYCCYYYQSMHVHLCIHMCRHTWMYTHRHMEDRDQYWVSSFIALHTIFWDWDLTWTWPSVTWLSSLDSKS